VHASWRVYDALVKIGRTHSRSLEEVLARHTRDVTWPSAASICERVVPFSVRGRTHSLRAYECWHHQNLPLEAMCVMLRQSVGRRGVALKPGTVV